MTEGQSNVIIDLEKSAMAQLIEAVAESKWIPPEYFMNDWINDCAHFLRTGEGITVSPTPEQTGELVELIALLRREGHYSKVWFGDDLLKAAAALEASQAQIARLTEALEEATDICATYANFIKEQVSANDIEVHPYLPRIERAVEDARAALAQGKQQ